MNFDITLKELFYRTPQQLLQLLVDSQIAEVLTVEYPTVQHRRPDFVARLTNGQIYHLELQSDVDTTMAWRMLEYYGLIYKLFNQAPLQQVLYVGQPAARFVTTIKQETLHFHYQLIDIREIDCTPLLNSASLEDNLLAVLCRIDNKRHTVKQILQKMRQLDQNKYQDAVQKLSILLGLRPLDLSTLFKQEAKEMGITVNLENNIMFKEAFERTRQKAEAHMLRRQLEHRFGELPEWVLERLEQAATDQLEEWGLNLLEAQQLEQVFH